jgi:hypothetical protein
MNPFTSRISAIVLTPFLALAALHANAAPIAGVTVSTTFASPADSGSVIQNVVNGSGLSSYTTGAAHAAGVPENAWAASGPVTGTITFDLGGIFDLDGMAVWNFNSNNIYGIARLTIDGSLDGNSYAPIAGAPTNFAIGALGAAELAELFSFTATAHFVRFNVASSHGGPGIGLSEVMFTGTAAAVPEPGTLALLGLGLAGLGLSRRRKGN